MKSFLAYLLASTACTSLTHATPYLSFGMGSTNIEISDVPVYASLQKDSSWTPTISATAGWTLSDSLTIEISGSSSKETELKMDPSSAYIPPYVRFPPANESYFTELRSLSLRVRYKQQFSNKTHGYVYGGTSLLFSRIEAKGGYNEVIYDDSELSIQAGLGLSYDFNEKSSFTLSIDRIFETNVTDFITVEATGIQLGFSRFF